MIEGKTTFVRLPDASGETVDLTNFLPAMVDPHSLLVNLAAVERLRSIAGLEKLVMVNEAEGPSTHFTNVQTSGFDRHWIPTWNAKDIKREPIYRVSLEDRAGSILFNAREVAHRIREATDKLYRPQYFYQDAVRWAYFADEALKNGLSDIGGIILRQQPYRLDRIFRFNFEFFLTGKVIVAERSVD